MHKYSAHEIIKTKFSGLFEINIPVHQDPEGKFYRGWFKENWHKKKFQEIGMDLNVVQHNISFNLSKGTIRGMHAEPWNKLVSVAFGSVFVAIVDGRKGSETFGEVYETYLDPTKSLLIPVGCYNSFQALEDNTVYSYLVTGHWSAGVKFPEINPLDTELNISWPIKENTILSEKDSTSRSWKEAKEEPLNAAKILVLGANGQLGRALKEILGDKAVYKTKEELDISKSESFINLNPNEFSGVINASAFTKVDICETEEGYISAWDVNVIGTQNLIRFTSGGNIPLVHISTDYVFDGKKQDSYTENDIPNALNNYGITKSIGDSMVTAMNSQHYVLRTSGVYGDGETIIKKLYGWAQEKKQLSFVNDQRLRLTNAITLAKACVYMLDKRPETGVYNVSDDGEALSWQEIAQFIYETTGADKELVSGISSEQYKEKNPNSAIRPKNSVFDLSKIKSIGFEVPDMKNNLKEYIKS